MLDIVKTPPGATTVPLSFCLANATVILPTVNRKADITFRPFIHLLM